jgi:drug/metabolite transporter (DMT)-like permease
MTPCARRARAHTTQRLSIRSPCVRRRTPVDHAAIMPAGDVPAHPHERLGLLFAGLCALNGAFVPALAKLTTEHADSVFVATATTVVAGLCAVAMLGIRGELQLLSGRPRATRLAIVGALGTAAAYLLFYAGTRRSTAIEAVLCLQIEPAYALIAAWLVLGHRPTRRRLVATTLLLIGIALAVGTEGLRGSSGVWLLLATPICWQASHLIVLRRLQGISPWVLTGARFLYGGAVLVVCWLLSGGIASAPSWMVFSKLWPLLVLQGLIMTFVGTLLWYQAVTRLDLARTTAIVVPSVPLLSLAASFILLGEVPSTRQLAGLALTATGVLIFVTAPHAITSGVQVTAITAEEPG